VEGASLARQVLAAAPDDPSTLKLAGIAIANLGRDYDTGLAAAERALALNPNSAHILSGAGWIHLYACEPAKAIPLFERAMRLSPLDPEMSHMLSGIGLAYMNTGNFEAAIKWGQRSIRHSPDWVSGHRVLIAALMLLGREEEARTAVAVLRTLASDDRRIVTSITPCRNCRCTDRNASALRAAGLPG
jgi:Flp pilus assembly protein TadD